MIITVTMNPAIDKTVDIDKLERGGLNRISHVEYDAGGKGINVSRTIYELGGESIATGFLGGNAGKTIENVLTSQGIKTDFVWVEGETRTNTKIFETCGTVTELNELGPDITQEQIDNLLEKLKNYAKEDVLFVLAGSIPQGVNTSIYKEIIKIVHDKGAKVLLDADGELFAEGIKAIPDIIKPNRAELESYAQFDYRASERELLNIAKDLMKKGVKNIIISLGKAGALMIGENYQISCQGLSVKAHSTVGAGDSMVAALAYSLDNKLEFEEMVKTCMAASAGAVTTIGTKPPKRELVEELKKEVSILKIV